MNNLSININYNVTNDYSKLHPLQYVNLLNLYNLILIPINFNINIKVSDEIKILNKTNNKYLNQTGVLDSGTINLGEQNYTYIYIANGISTENYSNNYELLINNQLLPLSKIIDRPDTCKLLIGSFILPDNYKYLFMDQDSAIINIDNTENKVKIINLYNKYNYYAANKHTTILDILDNDNFNILSLINNGAYKTKYIRPLYNTRFPLGSLSLSINNSGGVFNTEYKIFINNKSYLIKNNLINIKNLASGRYSIKIIDRNGILRINNLNGQPLDQDMFELLIPEVRSQDYSKNSKGTLPPLRQKTKPKKGLCNIMINLEHNQPIEIFGPNNFYQKHKSGYTILNDVADGSYTILQNDHKFATKANPNDTTYVTK